MPKTYRETANKKEILIYRKEKIAEFEDIYESIKPNMVSFTAKNIFSSITKHMCYVLALLFIVKGSLLLIPAEIYDRYSSVIPVNEDDFKKIASYGKFVLWFIGILFFFIASLIKKIQAKRYWIIDQSDLIENILEYAKTGK